MVTVTVGLVAFKISLHRKKSEKIRIKCIWLLWTPPQDGIGPGGKLKDEVDGIPGGLCHQTSTPDFEHFGWRLPKLATVTVTNGRVALPKAVWDVTVWRPVAYIQVYTVVVVQNLTGS
jgi:hypothetical protein